MHCVESWDVNDLSDKATAYQADVDNSTHIQRFREVGI
jgi:hypothetical protein